MRQIFLDTETTGLYPDQGHRIIEVAAVEVVNRRTTQRHLHHYINPQRDIDPAAQEVHGITLEFLQDKPVFESVAQEFLAFIQGAELIIHNAPFDVGFLNMELGRIGLKPIEIFCDKITDTLKMAKAARPGQRNNLDALCRHYGIDNARRTLHGALLDAELLADVYMAMTRGQDSLLIDLHPMDAQEAPAILDMCNIAIKLVKADDEERALHAAYVEGLKKMGAVAW